MNIMLKGVLMPEGAEFSSRQVEFGARESFLSGAGVIVENFPLIAYLYHH